jgi:glycosyltransferase involved in cell wall biosynthesis
MSRLAADFADVAVVMITMNEEGSIGRVVRDLRRDVPGAALTIVDSSSDRTPEIAIEEGVEVLRQFPPRGYGPAMMQALRHPARLVVVTLDCDDTYPTDRIAALVEMARSGWDVVGTTRLAGGRPDTMPLTNYVANRLFNLVASALFRRSVRDVHSGMRVYRRDTIHRLAWLVDAPALPVELLLLPMRAGLRVCELPIAYNERIGETTLARWSSARWTFIRLLRARTMRKKNYVLAGHDASPATLLRENTESACGEHDSAPVGGGTRDNTGDVDCVG